MRRQCGCIKPHSYRNMSKKCIHCQTAGRESYRGRLAVPKSSALGRRMCGICLVCSFMCSVPCAVSRAQLGTREEDTPLVAFFWMLILAEVGTLFWENDCMPARQEICIQHSLPERQAVGKEMGKRLRQRCWIQRKRKDRLFLGTQRDRTGLAAN